MFTFFPSNSNEFKGGGDPCERIINIYNLQRQNRKGQNEPYKNG